MLSGPAEKLSDIGLPTPDNNCDLAKLITENVSKNKYGPLELRHFLRRFPHHPA